MERIRRGEGNSAFRDEGQAHDKVRNQGVPFRRREFMPEEEHGQGQADRRDHAADHDGCHDAR